MIIKEHINNNTIKATNFRHNTNIKNMAIKILRRVFSLVMLLYRSIFKAENESDCSQNSRLWIVKRKRELPILNPKFVELRFT